MSLYWIGIEFFMSGIEGALFFMFLSKKLNMRKNINWIHYFIYWLIETSIITWATYISIYSNWKVLISFFIFFLCVNIFSDEKLKNKILTCFIFFGIVATSENLVSFIIMINNDAFNWNSIMSQSLARIFMFMVSKLLQIVIIVIIFHVFNEDNVYLPTIYWVVFLIMFALILIVSAFIMSLGGTLDNEFFNNIAIVINLVIMIFYFSFYFLFDRMSRYFQEMNTYNLLAYQDKAIEKYFLQRQESETNIRILSHDLKHSLSYFGEIANNNIELMEIINEYNHKLNENEMIDVRNEIANVIIGQKFAVAKKNGINFEVRGCFYEELKISKVDLISLLANLLDNALEANLKICSNLEKKINLTITKQNNLLMLNILNTYEVDPIIKNGVFISDKNEKGIHGIGIVSIRNVVEKYNGAMISDFNEHVFLVDIVLEVYGE